MVCIRFRFCTRRGSVIWSILTAAPHGVRMNLTDRTMKSPAESSLRFAHAAAAYCFWVHGQHTPSAYAAYEELFDRLADAIAEVRKQGAVAATAEPFGCGWRIRA